MSDAFLTRVSFAGVPHTLPHSETVSQAGLFPLSPQVVCKLYWTLSSLSVAYAYEINGTRVERNFSATSSLNPKNRLISPAIFYYSQYDSQLQTSRTINLSWNRIYFDPEDNSKIGLDLILREADTSNVLKLTLQPENGMENVSRTFSFMDKDLSAYLNYNQSLVTSAALTEFSLVPQFFTL